MSAPRSWRLISFDLEDGNLADAIAGSELAHLSAEGWTWGGSWVGVDQDRASGGIIGHRLNFAMVPPSPIDTMERAEREALAALVQATQEAHGEHGKLLRSLVAQGGERHASLQSLVASTVPVFKGLEVLADQGTAQAQQLQEAGRIAGQWMTGLRAMHEEASKQRAMLHDEQVAQRVGLALDQRAALARVQLLLVAIVLQLLTLAWILS